LFKRTAVLLDTVRDLLHDFDFERRLERPVVAIGVSSSVSNAFTADYFLPLLERQDLHVVIRHGDHDGLLHQLLMRELDLLLSEHSPVEARAKGLEVRTVDRPALVAVATPPLARRMSGEWPACLEGMPYLTYTAHSAYREHVDGFLDEHRVVGHVVAEVDDLGVLRASAARGIGAAFLPAPVLPSLDEELVEIGRFPEVPDGVTAIYRHYEPPQPVMEAIVQLLEQVEARAKATASSSIE
jgi:LysR family transcriptional activator of nhaA